MISAKQKAWNLLTFMGVLTMVILVCVGFGLTRNNLPDTLNGVNLVAENFVGCMVCLILFVSIFFDRRMNLTSVSIQLMIFLMFVRLISDMNSMVFQTVGGNIIINELCRYLMFCTTPAILAVLWMYIRSMSDIDSKRIVFLDILSFALFAVSVFVITTNIDRCWDFTLDPTGTFSEFITSFLLVTLVPTIQMLLCAFLIWAYVKNKRDKFHYTLALIIPAAGMVLQVMHPDFNNMTLGLLLMIFLLYGNTYVNYGYELSLKKISIKNLIQNMFVSQMQPKFVNSTLERIRDLPGNPPEMKGAIELFSKYIQNNLDSIEEVYIPFSTELEHVKVYVGLEKLRFKDKLDVVYDIKDEDFDIPPLILQMVVENAIKHGITQTEKGGTVHISTRKTATDHVIVVKDDGVGFDVNNPIEEGGRNHIGIVNSKRRLSEVLGGKINIESEINKGTVATITIPRYDVV